MKNKKFLLDIQIKCGNIANEILNLVIDAEGTIQMQVAYFIGNNIVSVIT